MNLSGKVNPLRSKAPSAVRQRRRTVVHSLRWPFLEVFRSPVQRRRDELLQKVVSKDSPLATIDTIIDELIETKQPFRPAALGRGPWVVVYTRGPAQLWKATQSAASKLTNTTKNRASQEFDPRTNGALNKAEFGAPEFFVTASGSYEVEGQSSILPVLVQANIEEGCLHAWGWKLPLPIRGTGKFEILYLDDKVRIFKSGNSYSVQVQCDELDRLIG